MADLVLIGALHEIMPVQSGTSADGRAWQRGGFVIKLPTEWESYAAFTLWAERVEMIKNFNIGDQIAVSFSVNSRSYEDRWYTDLRAQRIDYANQMQQQPYPQAGYAPYPGMQPGYQQQPYQQMPQQQPYAPQYQQPMQNPYVQPQQPYQPQAPAPGPSIPAPTPDPDQDMPEGDLPF